MDPTLHKQLKDTLTNPKVFIYPFKRQFLNTFTLTIGVLSLFLSVTSQAIFICRNISDMEAISSCTHSVMAFSGSLLKFLIFLHYKHKIYSINEEILGSSDVHPKTPNQERILKEGLRLSRLVYKSYLYLGIVTLLLGGAPPVFAKRRVLMFNGSFPFDPYSTRYYFAVCLWQFSSLAFVLLICLAMDLLFFQSLLQIRSQCDVLNDKIVHLARDVGALREDFRACVLHHKAILR